MKRVLMVLTRLCRRMLNSTHPSRRTRLLMTMVLAFTCLTGWSRSLVVSAYYTVGNLKFYCDKDTMTARVCSCDGKDTVVNVPETFVYEEELDVGEEPIYAGTYTVVSVFDKEYDGFSIGARKAVEKVVLPSSVTTIGRKSFSECSNLTTVEAPSVTHVDLRAFYRCRSLVDLQMDFSKLVEIGGSAFEGCSAFAFGNLRLPKLQRLDSWAFAYCNGLTGVELGTQIDAIPDGAFAGCENLSFVKFNTQLRSLASAAFSGCKSLKEFTIPSDCTFTAGVFGGCESLERIDFEGAPSAGMTGTFSGLPTSARGYYKQEFKNEWESALDDDGMWHGLRMQPQKAEDPPGGLFAVHVSFDPNCEDAQGEVTPMFCDRNKDHPYPECGFRRSGWTFLGWSREPNGRIDPVFYPSEKMSFTDQDPDEVVYYAIWEQLVPIQVCFRTGISLLESLDDDDVHGTADWCKWKIRDGDGAWHEDKEIILVRPNVEFTIDFSDVHVDASGVNWPIIFQRPNSIRVTPEKTQEVQKIWIKPGNCAGRLCVFAHPAWEDRTGGASPFDSEKVRFQISKSSDPQEFVTLDEVCYLSHGSYRIKASYDGQGWACIDDPVVIDTDHVQCQSSGDIDVYFNFVQSDTIGADCFYIRFVANDDGEGVFLGAGRMAVRAGQAFNGANGEFRNRLPEPQRVGYHFLGWWSTPTGKQGVDYSIVWPDGSFLFTYDQLKQSLRKSDEEDNTYFLYARWEKDSNENFRRESCSDGWRITEYASNDLIVDIPYRLNARGIATIASGAFSSKQLKRLTVSADVSKIETAAFVNCPNLAEVQFDGAVPEGLMTSGLLDCAKKVYYPKSYEKQYSEVIPTDLFAGYSDEHTVTFWGDGGYVDWLLQRVIRRPHGAQLGVVPTVYREGYEFAGWVNRQSYAGLIIGAIDPPLEERLVDVNVNDQVVSNVSYYAEWIPIAYDIVYEDTRGLPNPNPTYYTVTNKVEFLPLSDLPTYSFSGWSLSEIPRGSMGRVVIKALWQERTESDGVHKGSVNGVEWSYVISNGVAIVSSGSENVAAIDTQTEGDVVVPGTLGGVPVRSIGAYAFADCKQITSVTIPSSVESIGERAFEKCWELAEVYGGEGVRFVDKYAFAGTTWAAEYSESGFEPLYLGTVLCAYRGGPSDKSKPLTLSVREGTTSISPEAFSDMCDYVLTVDIPASVREIGYEAFSYARYVTKFQFHGDMPEIGYGFYHNVKEQDAAIYVPDWASGWPSDGMFQGLPVRRYAAPVVTPADGTYTQTVNGVSWVYAIKDGVAILGYNEDSGQAAIPTSTAGRIVIPASFEGCSLQVIGIYAFRNCTNVTEIVVPDSVTTLRYDAFYGCRKLTRVDLPDRLVGIETYAFEGCERLETIEIPAGVSKVNGYAFARCRSLLEIDVSADNTSYKSYDGILLSKDGTVLVAFPSGRTEVSFPSGVTKLADGAFYAGSAKRICVPATIRELGTSVFMNSDVEEMAFDATAQTLPQSTFFGCYSLSNVELPDGLEEIGDYAFRVCSSLKTIAIPKGVKKIGAEAFGYCRALTCVDFIGGPPSDVAANAFAHVKDGCVGTYRSEYADAWLRVIDDDGMWNGLKMELAEVAPETAESKASLAQGWSWISFNVVPADATLDAVFAGVSFADEDVVMSAEDSATYYGGKWYGALAAFKPGVAYRVKKSTAGEVTLTVSGTAAETSLAVAAGWNWIGSTATEEKPLDALVHSGGFTDEDVIKSADASATYYGGKWYGELKTLKPGVGYRAKFAKAGTISFLK